MMSAYDRTNVPKAVEDLNLAGFLSKPITPSQLHNAVLTAMGYQSVGLEHTDDRSENVAKAVNKLRGAKILLVEDNEINQELALEAALKNKIGNKDELLEKLIVGLQPVVAGLQKLRKESLQ